MIHCCTYFVAVLLTSSKVFDFQLKVRVINFSYLVFCILSLDKCCESFTRLPSNCIFMMKTPGLVKFETDILIFFIIMAIFYTTGGNYCKKGEAFHT